MSAETRNYVHVDFDVMTCPITDCKSGKGGEPQTGSVPGIKRHVKLVHGQEAYDKAVKNGLFPPLRSADGPIKNLHKDKLLEAAKSRGLADKDASPSKYSKDQLVGALTSGVSLVKKASASSDDIDALLNG